MRYKTTLGISTPEMRADWKRLSDFYNNASQPKASRPTFYRRIRKGVQIEQALICKKHLI